MGLNRKIFRLYVSLFLIFIFFGCAAPQKYISRAEWLELTTREYKSVSPEQVFSAVEKLFRLADKRDTEFTYSPNTITALRFTAPFPVLIWYHWSVSAVTTEVGTKVNISITTSSEGFATLTRRKPYQSIDVIHLFYSRLDYLLGKSDKWVTCKEYPINHPEHTTLEALCALADDLSPIK